MRTCWILIFLKYSDSMLLLIRYFSSVHRFDQSDGTIKSKMPLASGNLIGSAKLVRSPFLLCVLLSFIILVFTYPVFFALFCYYWPWHGIHCVKKIATKSFHQRPGGNQKPDTKHSVSYIRQKNKTNTSSSVWTIDIPALLINLICGYISSAWC